MGIEVSSATRARLLAFAEASGLLALAREEVDAGRVSGPPERVALVKAVVLLLDRAGVPP